MAYQEIIFSPAELMQSALTKVNENFTELYNNPVQNIGTMAGIDVATPTVIAIDITKTIYYVDCTGGDVTAQFDVSTFGNKVICFIRIDNSAYKFRIDEISGSPSIVIDSGYVTASNQNKGQANMTLTQRYPITLDAAGAVRALGTLTLLVTGIGGTSACRGSIKFREIR